MSPALLILGDMSVQGNIKPMRSLTEPLQVAKDNGARRALIPIENKRSFLDVSADIMEHVDPIFYGDPRTAAMKVLGGRRSVPPERAAPQFARLPLDQPTVTPRRSAGHCKRTDSGGMQRAGLPEIRA